MNIHGLMQLNNVFQVQHSFDDPEGKIEMPPTMKVDHWKRPQDYITEKVWINKIFKDLEMKLEQRV